MKAWSKKSLSFRLLVKTHAVIVSKHVVFSIVLPGRPQGLKSQSLVSFVSVCVVPP